ncbi:caldesmon-like [Trichoplusia ni]|uniref:Caldesmon-like n=1 Tax=Trichoplusia ni TaxID=7111 RepID=A0A7E5VH72_TRINI|nr:caldesmon-like [Trichoplusia ni]
MMLIYACTIMLSIAIMICESQAYYEKITSPNVGTVLFSTNDVNKKQWSKTDIGLLRARKYFQSLLPPPVFINTFSEDYVKILLGFFRDAYAAIKKESHDPETDTIMTTALSDAIGGYLKVWVLPVAKLDYYGGTVSQNNVIKLFQFYNEIKRYLDTDGAGWRKPDENVLNSMTINVAPLKLVSNTRSMSDPCDHLAYFEKTPNGLTIPIPNVHWNEKVSTLFVPLKNVSLIPMNAPDTANNLIKYYDSARGCIQASNPKEQEKFDERFQAWLAKEVVPHLKDEHLYLALGSVLSLVNRTRELCNNVVDLYDTHCGGSTMKTGVKLFRRSHQTSNMEFEAQYPSSLVTNTVATGTRSYFSSKDQSASAIKAAPDIVPRKSSMKKFSSPNFSSDHTNSTHILNILSLEALGPERRTNTSYATIQESPTPATAAENDRVVRGKREKSSKHEREMEERRKAEEWKQYEEKMKLEELIRAEEARKFEERRVADEYRKLQERMKADEARRFEDGKRAEEAREREERRADEELKRLEDLKKAEEYKQLEELRRAEECRRLEELKRTDEIRRQENLKRVEELKRLEETKKCEEKKRLDDLKKAEELRKQQQRKRVEEHAKSAVRKHVEEHRKYNERHKSGDSRKSDTRKICLQPRRPEERKRSTESRSPEQRKRSTDSRSPEERRRSAESRSLKDHERSTESKSPENNKRSAQSRSPETRSPETRSPENRKKNAVPKKPEERKRSEDSKKVDERKRPEECRRMEEFKKVDDRRKTDESRKQEERRKSEEAKKYEERKKQEERRKHEERRKAALKRQEERKKLEDFFKKEVEKTAQEIKQIEEGYKSTDTYKAKESTPRSGRPGTERRKVIDLEKCELDETANSEKNNTSTEIEKPTTCKGPVCACANCLQSSKEIVSICEVTSGSLTESKTVEDKQVETKTTRFQVTKEYKTTKKGIKLPSGKPYLEITIDRPATEISVDVGGIRPKPDSQGKPSKIPKLTTCNVMQPIYNSQLPSLTLSPTEKRKSMIPQLKRKTVDDLDVSTSHCPKSDDSRLNDTF